MTERLAIHHEGNTSATPAIKKLQATVREQQRQIAALKEALERGADERAEALADAQALTHLGSWQWDIATNDISWSDELYRIYGLKPQEHQVGFEEFLSMIHPDDRDMVNKTIGESFQSGKPFQFEHRIILPNKSVRALSGMGKVITDSKGKPIRMIGTSQDITERKEVERALQQSDQRFRSVTQATHDLVYDIDLINSSIWFNESLQTEYGYPMATMGKSLTWWTSRIHHEDRARVQEQIRDLLASKQNALNSEHRFRKADGSYVIVRNRAFVLRDANGKPERITGSFLDITEAKRLDRAKDEFITLVSHQLRTPLTIIRLYGNMLTDGIAGQLSGDQQAYVDKITSASVRLIKLVGDILNISRLELNRIKIEASPTDANALIQSCIDELMPVAKAKAAQINFKPRSRMGLVPIDTTVFGEIVNNLIGNALRYVREDQGQVDVSFVKERRGYLLTVRDNGIGIPPSAQTHIFERFYRARNAVNADGEGTGLGLYLVKLFVDTAGGNIWFDSQEKKGTTFYVLFPPEGMHAQAGASK